MIEILELNQIINIYSQILNENKNENNLKLLKRIFERVILKLNNLKNKINNEQKIEFESIINTIIEINKKYNINLEQNLKILIGSIESLKHINLNNE